MKDFFINEIITLKKLLQNNFNEEFKELNLKSSEIKLIHILSFNEGESQAELAKRLECDKAHIHRLVIKLLMKKIICFANQKHVNCRNIHITLTDHGKEIAKKINKKLQEWQKNIIEGIYIEDLFATKRVFNQIIDNLRKEKKDV